MTLNITVLTPQTIYLSADFRLTEFDTGKPIKDPSPKTVTLTYLSWTGFVTYTGVGSWEGRNVSDLVAEWLTGTASPSIADVAQVIATRGTELLRIIEMRHRRRRHHTFTLAGFDGDRVKAYVISNFEDCRGNSRASIDDRLSVTMRTLGAGQKATVVVTGRKSAVSPGARRLLGSVAARYPGESLRIGRRMAEINVLAASRSGGAVSRDCVILSFSADGSGGMLLDDSAAEIPKQFPHISNGMDLNKMLSDVLRSLGVDPSMARVRSASFGSSREQSSPVERVPCRYAVVDSDSSSGYRLEEIAVAAFELLSPREISDRREIVGTGRLKLGQPQDIPWSYFDGRVERLPYTGAAVSVNDRSQIAAVLWRGAAGSAVQRAALYERDTLTEFPLYHGDVGEFVGTDASAAALSARGMVAGEVRSQPEVQGRPNTRAALFRAGLPTQAFMGLVAEFGTRGIDINENGHMLVMAGIKVFDVRSALWDPIDDSWEYVGDETSNVFPIALNDDDVVLGQARNASGQAVAVICRPGGRWERAGTDDNWIPIDINNKGEIIGRVAIERIERPWLRRASGEIVLMPRISDHHTSAAAINNLGQVVGAATADHGGHALVWSLATGPS